MDDGATGRDATVSLFGPARNTILLLLGTAALAAPLFSLAAGQVPELEFSLQFGAMLVAAGVIALSRFRDPVLAAAAALAPLPGVSFVFCGTFATTVCFHRRFSRRARVCAGIFHRTHRRRRLCHARRRRRRAETIRDADAARRRSFRRTRPRGCARSARGACRHGPATSGAAAFAGRGKRAGGTIVLARRSAGRILPLRQRRFHRAHEPRAGRLGAPFRTNSVDRARALGHERGGNSGRAAGARRLRQREARRRQRSGAALRCGRGGCRDAGRRLPRRT